MVRKGWIISVMLAVLLIVITACIRGPILTSNVTPTSTIFPTPGTSGAFSQYQLAYRLFSIYPDIFWCDPDYYPISREGQEAANAREQFPSIRQNVAEFGAILEHLKLPEKSDYTDAEEMSIYREHKKLTRAVIMVPSSANSYDFSLRVGENEGQHIEGTIDSLGRIKIVLQEPSFNTCPICLARGTIIDTPDGPVQVEDLRPGMSVWTGDTIGNQIATTVIKTSVAPVPHFFQVIRVSLSDGRNITSSPGHPTAEKRALIEYHIGDTLDSGLVTAVEWLAYTDGATYDLLPAGNLGIYRANGIWLGSTLAID